MNFHTQQVKLFQELDTYSIAYIASFIAVYTTTYYTFTTAFNITIRDNTITKQSANRPTEAHMYYENYANLHTKKYLADF